MNTPITCFIIMPFRQELGVVRDTVTELVEKQSTGTAFRADDSFHPGNVMDQVKGAIADADFCVADVSGANPNVLWEAGYAHALGKPVIQIGQDTANLPFDIRALRTLQYSLSELNQSRGTNATTPFHAALADAVLAVVQGLRNRPRILGPPYDELHELAESLQRRSLFTRRVEPVLGVVMSALQWDRANGPKHPWSTVDAERLMQAIARVASNLAQDTFWWLIVHGVLAFDQIDQFQVSGCNGWRDNLHLVRVSNRGVALLNHLKEPC
jgi:hypothetical protein